MFKQDLTLNRLPGLICNKTQQIINNSTLY